MHPLTFEPDHDWQQVEEALTGWAEPTPVELHDWDQEREDRLREYAA